MLAYRLGWIALAQPALGTAWRIYALASVLTFFNVWFSAQMMFASEHDLLLASSCWSLRAAWRWCWDISSPAHDRTHPFAQKSRGNLQRAT
jgi:hypothetical protein